MATFISANDKQCRNAFSDLLRALRYDAKVGDEYDRYKIWAANVGAGHSGSSYKRSLDYRLREAPAYKDQIVAILDQLERQLSDAYFLAFNTPEEGSDSSSDDDGLNYSDTANAGVWTLSDSEEGDAALPPKTLSQSQHPNQLESRALTWLSDTSSSRLQLTMDSISFAITCLYKIPIREAASYSRLKRYHKAAAHDFDIYAHFDKLFVRDLFRNANEKVVSRLAKLVTERRRILKFRMRHNEELQEETTGSRDADIAVHEAVAPLSLEDQIPLEMDRFTEKQASTLPKSSLKASTFRPRGDLNIGAENLLSSAISEADDSISMASTRVENRVTIPPRPRNPQGEELEDFVCPLCCITKHISSWYQWKAHIFKDLKPYVCTYPECTEPDKLYTSLDDWFLHENEHYAHYFCGTAKHEPYDQAEAFVKHMRTSHNLTLALQPTALEPFRRSGTRKGGICNLCGEYTANLKHHKGKHLQRVALFALSRNITDSDASENSEDSQASRRIQRISQTYHIPDHRSLAEEDDGGSEALSENYEVENEPPPDAPEDITWAAIKPELQPEEDKPTVSRAELFEDEKQRITKSCFSKLISGGSSTLQETYITHIRIIQYSISLDRPPPAGVMAEQETHRVLIIAVRHSGSVRIHKGRENSDGSFSIGKTWPLENLTAIAVYDEALVNSEAGRVAKVQAGNLGFVLTIGKPYYWQAATSRERDLFLLNLTEIYIKFTETMPTLLGFPSRLEEQIIKGKFAALATWI